MDESGGTDLFLALTPDRVLQAVETGGLPCNPVCYALNSFENRVYEVELQDRSRVVAKFYRPGRWSETQILEEHQFLRDLQEEEIPVVAALEFPGGGTLRRMENILYALFERRGGRAPDELDDAAVVRLGRLIARVHNVGARRAAEHRLRLTAETYARVDLDWLAEHDSVPASLVARYFAAAEEICGVYERWSEGLSSHRLHGDLHLGNLLLRDAQFLLVDFDDMMVGPAVQDLWLAVAGRDGYAARQRQLLIAAYEELREFDRASLRLIEPLRGLRRVHYAAWLARRWHDPVFPRTFPQFGDDEYWRSETEDLEEILAHVRGTAPAADLAQAGLAARETAEEAPLTNKELFWDWEGN
jgi:Ser/Thr protein kinase RdoA (MazF antagonist)